MNNTKMKDFSEEKSSPLDEVDAPYPSDDDQLVQILMDKLLRDWGRHVRLKAKIRKCLARLSQATIEPGANESKFNDQD
jgi:hypothetical protein